MKKIEKLNEKESFDLGTYIVALYGACDSRTKEALIITFLEDMKAIKDGCIPIIYGKAELKLHDKAIRTKTIDDFADVLKENYDYLPQIISQESFGRYIDEYAERYKLKD